MRKRIKFSWMILLVLFSCCTFFGALSGQALAEKLVIKAISAWPVNDSSVAEDFLPFVKHLNEALQKAAPDAVEVKHIGGPESIATKDQPEALRNGLVHMYFGAQAYYAGMAPAANMSFLTQLTPWEERTSGAYDLFNEIHQNSLNSYYLGRLGSKVPFQLWGNMDVKTPEDLKGLKVRGTPIHIPFLKALGIQPVSIPPADIYVAVERGVVNGFCWPYTKLKDGGFNEVTKFAIGPGFYTVTRPVLVNMTIWNKLPENAKKVFVDVMKIEEKAVIARDQKKIEDATAWMKEIGVKMIEFSPEGSKKYLDLAYSSGWEDMMKRAPEYGEKLRKALSKQHDSRYFDDNGIGFDSSGMMLIETRTAWLSGFHYDFELEGFE